MFLVSLVVIALLCGYMLHKFTIYALPCLTGATIGQFAFTTGAGDLGSAAVGLAAAILTFVIFRWLFLDGPAAIRWLAGAITTATTVVFAYFLLDDITSGNVPSEIWRQILCVTGAGAAGLITFAKLAVRPGQEV